MKQEPKTVFVVDDDAAIRATVRDILEDEGYRVVSADNGHAALSYLRSAPTPPAVILLDLMMPEMDGVEFRHRQQHDQSIQQIPVVVMTASANAQHVQALNAAHYLPKPFSYDRLVQAISDVV